MTSAVPKAGRAGAEGREARRVLASRGGRRGAGRHEDTLAVNVRAPRVLTAALAERGDGAIVVIGSWMAGVGHPFVGLYSATKAAEAQLARSWAAEFGPRGLGVNTVSPDATRTPINADADDVVARMTAATPAGSTGTPDEVAAAVAWVLSDAAGYIHGADFPVDASTLVCLVSIVSLSGPVERGGLTGRTVAPRAGLQASGAASQGDLKPSTGLTRVKQDRRNLRANLGRGRDSFGVSHSSMESAALACNRGVAHRWNQRLR